MNKSLIVVLLLVISSCTIGGEAKLSHNEIPVPRWNGFVDRPCAYKADLILDEEKKFTQKDRDTYVSLSYYYHEKGVCRDQEKNGKPSSIVFVVVDVAGVAVYPIMIQGRDNEVNREYINSFHLEYKNYLYLPLNGFYVHRNPNEGDQELFERLVTEVFE